MKLLSREDFKTQVFARDGGKCVFCEKDAVDAHHILDRKLWNDGGYYIANGASVCEEHHWGCEQTTITVEEVREAAKISMVLVPPEFAMDKIYDKWGNVLNDDGTITKGPLFEDTAVQKLLKVILWKFV
jgi:hypothetical protein